VKGLRNGFCVRRIVALQNVAYVREKVNSEKRHTPRGDFRARIEDITFEEIRLAEDKTYKAEYLGSGTFTISKPKRTKAKRRQTNLKNPQRGARK